MDDQVSIFTVKNAGGLERRPRSDHRREQCSSESLPRMDEPMQGCLTSIRLANAYLKVSSSCVEVSPRVRVHDLLQPNLGHVMVKSLPHLREDVFVERPDRRQDLLVPPLDCIFHTRCAMVPWYFAKDCNPSFSFYGLLPSPLLLEAKRVQCGTGDCGGNCCAYCSAIDLRPGIGGLGRLRWPPRIEVLVYSYNAVIRG